MQHNDPRQPKSINNERGIDKDEPLLTSDKGIHPVANAMIKANKGFDVVHTAADTLATAYVYASPYAWYAKSMWYNAMYFTPTGGAVLLHVMPFRPESKKRYLGYLEKALHVSLNSGFISTLAQEVFLLSMKDVTRTEYTIAVSVINGAVTLAVVAPSIWDLNMREGQNDYANWQKYIVKFALRPLAFGAMPLFFLSTFSEHLHDSPDWMPLVVSSVLAGSMLVYQIVNEMKDGLHKVNKFIDDVVADGFLTSLSTSSVFFIVINSLIAAYNNDEIPDAAFYGVLSLCVTLMALTTASSAIDYKYGQDEHDPERDRLVAYVDEDSGDADFVAGGPLSDVLDIDAAKVASVDQRVEILDSDNEDVDNQSQQSEQPKVSLVSIFATKELNETKVEIAKTTMEIEETNIEINSPKTKK